MLVGSIHLSPSITLPPALAAASVLVWSWLRAGRPSVPAPRRRVRRTSISLMLLGLPALVRGMSFIDHDLEPQAYVVTWSVVIVLVLLVLFTAVIDMVVSVRLHRAVVEREMNDAAEALLQAARRTSKDAPSDRGDQSEPSS